MTAASGCPQVKQFSALSSFCELQTAQIMTLWSPRRAAGARPRRQRAVPQLALAERDDLAAEAEPARRCTERLDVPQHDGGHAPQPDGSAADLGDLWAWDGTAWQALTQIGDTPGIRASAAMTHDPLTGRMLLYGGSNDIGFHADTWLWDSSAWSLHPAGGPGPRTFHSLAFDEARQRLVLFGGYDRPLALSLTDTWEWDGTAWGCAVGC